MSGKIPDDAFDFYVAMGAARSYQAVADRYGVSKRAVVKHAAKERWAERIAEIQEAARAESDKDLAKEVVEMRERHKRMLRVMAARSIAGLKELQFKSGMEAMRSADIVIRLERIVFGDGAERGEESIEEITKREIQTLLRPVEDEETDEDDPDEGDDAGSGELAPA